MKTYFIRATGGMHKIGKSANPEERLKDLQCANPKRLVLAAVVDGDFEKRFHDHFHSIRVRGEWFRPSNRLQAFIVWLNAGGDPYSFHVFNLVYKHDRRRLQSSRDRAANAARGKK